MQADKVASPLPWPSELMKISWLADRRFLSSPFQEEEAHSIGLSIGEYFGIRLMGRV